jgi:outer membrane lipoprotein-sorting protein
MRLKPPSLLIAACLGAALSLSGAGAAEFSAEERAVLDRVSTYLNGIESAQGNFVQIAADGMSDDGIFYLRKPGRVRFEYAAPNPNLIVADGATIAVSNSDLNTTDRYPLTDSPLRLLLSNDVDLTDDPRVVAVRQEAGALRVTARQEDGLAQGEITLEFADTGTALELRQWEVTDAQGLRTLIAVTDLRQGVTLSPALFLIEDDNPFGRQEF